MYNTITTLLGVWQNSHIKLTVSQNSYSILFNELFLTYGNYKNPFGSGFHMRYLPCAKGKIANHGTRIVEIYKN